MELLIKNLPQKNLVNAPDKTGLTVLFYVLKNPNGSSMLQLLFENDLVNMNEKDKVRENLLNRSN